MICDTNNRQSIIIYVRSINDSTGITVCVIDVEYDRSELNSKDSYNGVNYLVRFVWMLGLVYLLNR